MAAPLIEHRFTATGQSPAVLGYELGRNEPHNYAGVRHTVAAAQVVQTTGNAAFSVTLERGIQQADGSVEWDTDKTFTVDGDVQDVNLAPGCMYRFNAGTLAANNAVLCLLN